MSLPHALKALARRALPERYRQRARHWLDVVDTEWHFRTSRKSIRAELEHLRHIPRGLHVEGTNTCNAECVFCAYPQMERKKQVMSQELFERVVRDYLAMGGHHVSLTPIVGDPFVDRFLFERLDFLMALPEVRGISFYTNAILMSADKCERLLDYASKLHVHVSWGGYDEPTWNTIMGVNKFDKARDAVLAFLEIKERRGSSIPFTLALRCPNPPVKNELQKHIEACAKRGLVEIAPMEDYDSWAGMITPEALAAVGLKPRVMPYKRGACELLFTKPVVLADGRVNACACRDVEAELIVGNVHDAPLSKIWGGEAITDLIDRHQRGDYPDVCKRCTYFISVYNSRKSRTFSSKGALAGNWSED
ncbi:MAG TPA: radical SAM protein [Planctomycetota bacterium]|nr:radical SAM protein [Planctomycetota bacterium]